MIVVKNVKYYQFYHKNVLSSPVRHPQSTTRVETQTSPVAKPPLKLVVEALRASDQNGSLSEGAQG